MDDFNITSLHESKSEWGARLITILCPLIIEGVMSIFNESIKLCRENNEETKYLMTFQNFISRIPKWNTSIIENEKKRILEKSKCSYLEELITCIHIIQLKLLTAIRVGQKQKKINISIPKLDDFIHKIYIHSARKIYKNVYLFELNIPPLQTQKNNRELEILIQESIMLTIRESIPVESILRAYMDETMEEDYIEEIKEEVTETPIEPSPVIESEKEKNARIANEEKISRENEARKSILKMKPSIQNEIEPSEDDIEKELSSLGSLPSINTSLKFDDTDYVRDMNNNVEQIVNSKNIEDLEIKSIQRNLERKNAEMIMDNDNDDDNNDISSRLRILDDDINIDMNDLDIEDLETNEYDEDLLGNIEVLE
jgi:hypothetical protein